MVITSFRTAWGGESSITAAWLKIKVPPGSVIICIGDRNKKVKNFTAV